MLAAQGAIAPRPLEQLGMRMLSLRSGTRKSCRPLKAPAAAAGGRAGRLHRARRCADRVRELFVSRGIQPSSRRRQTIEEPVIDADESGVEVEERGGTEAAVLSAAVANMTVPEKGSAHEGHARDARDPDRDPNRMVAAAVLSCPKVNDAEVEAFAKMGNVSEDILRTIASTRAWTKSYGWCSAWSRTPRRRWQSREPDAATHRDRREAALDGSALQMRCGSRRGGARLRA